jgi:hypothetical protein
VGKRPTVGIILRPLTPKIHGNFTVFLLTLYKIKPSDGNKRRQQTEEEVDNRKQRSTKITREGMKLFICNAIVNYCLSSCQCHFKPV